jgi:DNA-binding NtrC family response regulator
MINGESGTGKELVARVLHDYGRRRQGPFVAINMAAIPRELVESELFGHEKGAFTGAHQRKLGRFELANGGTLFLDELTELPLETQAKLLRAVQEREVERVGGVASIPIDVRIVAATNRDLAAEVKAGRFRSDLYFRLNVFPLHIPPLRDRRDDIPLIARGFLARLAENGGAPKDIDDDALDYLRAYDWPGNVRELENVLERAAVLALGPRVTTADLPELASAAAPEPESLKDRVNAFERDLVSDALRRANGNQSEAARLLQTSRATLQYRMKILGL